MKYILTLAAIFLISNNVLAMEAQKETLEKKCVTDNTDFIEIFGRISSNPKNISLLTSPPNDSQQGEIYLYRDTVTDVTITAHHYYSTYHLEEKYYYFLNHLEEKYYPLLTFQSTPSSVLLPPKEFFNFIKIVYDNRNNSISAHIPLGSVNKI